MDTEDLYMNLRNIIGSLLSLASLLEAQAISIPWSGYGHDPQHSGISAVAAQPFNRIKWSTPVDLVLQNTPGTLFIHYGSPLVTAANTVIVPVRTTAGNTYRVDVLAGATGAPKYSLASAWTPPAHDWIPVFAPTLTPRNRLYYPGPGGTVLYRDQPDSNTGAAGQIAFFGNALYAANQATFNSNVQISTPLVSDRYGDIFFGFTVSGTNPAGLVSGMARIDLNGNGSYITATTASGGDGSVIEVPLNCAPALSIDNFTLYFAVSGGDRAGGYLVSVDSRNLAPLAHVRLKDPNLGSDASLLDDSSAAPTVGPDGDVYYGVFETACCSNHDRGWLLHFDKTLSTRKTPGAFGWDSTASIVTSKLVPSYHGTSTYLLFSKYNNYVDRGGDGVNRIAILDPNATQTDPVTGASVMKEVMTITGVTPEGTDGAVREWCINSAAVDTVTRSIIANSEDGVVYRWDLTSNTFTQSLRLTPGVGEAYTPTVIGVDGTGYAINDAVLFAFGQ